MALTVDECRRRGEFLVASRHARERGDFVEAVRLYEGAMAIEKEAKLREEAEWAAANRAAAARKREGELGERVSGLEARLRRLQGRLGG